MARTYLLKDHLRILKIIFLRSSISPSTFRLCVVVKGTSWMFSANGLDRYMMPKGLEIPASTIK